MTGNAETEVSQRLGDLHTKQKVIKCRNETPRGFNDKLQRKVNTISLQKGRKRGKKYDDKR